MALEGCYEFVILAARNEKWKSPFELSSTNYIKQLKTVTLKIKNV